MAITLLQSVQAGTVQATSNVSIAQKYSSNTTAGSFLIAMVRLAMNSSTPIPSAATMTTSGITWSLAALVTSTSGDHAAFAVYYCPSAASVSSATNNTFAATIGQGNAAGLTLYEFAGMGAGTFDKNVAAGASNTTPNPGSISAAQAGELIIATFVAASSATSGMVNPSVNASFATGQTYAPNIFSDVGSNQTSMGVDEYLLSSASGANATTYGAGTNFTFWGAVAFAFIPAASAAGGTQMPPFFIGSKSG